MHRLFCIIIFCCTIFIKTVISGVLSEAKNSTNPMNMRYIGSGEMNFFIVHLNRLQIMSKYGILLLQLLHISHISSPLISILGEYYEKHK